MNAFYIYGTPQEILQKVSAWHPEVSHVLEHAHTAIGTIKAKREIYEYQAAALYHFAKWYDRPGAQILEIGTALGYSAAVLALAAQQAQITTLNPKEVEATIATRNLTRWSNVKVIQQSSQDFLIDAGMYDMIFVDGDHKRVQEDLGYLLHLNMDGLIVFHDYSPEGSGRPCPPVYTAINRLCAFLNRPLDVIVLDNVQQVGMVGLFRK